MRCQLFVNFSSTFRQPLSTAVDTKSKCQPHVNQFNYLFISVLGEKLTRLTRLTLK